MASLVATNTSMMTMDVQYFIGAGAERASANFKADVNAPSAGYSETFKNDENDTALKLKMGAILNKTHRISISHAKFGGEDTDVNVILGNYDYLIPLNNEFRLYTGVDVSGKFKIEDSTSMFAGINYKF